MTRLALVAPIAVLTALFAGCASRGPAEPAPVAISPIEQSYGTGTGVVQAVTPAPRAVVAGAGGSASTSAAPTTPARSPVGVSDTAMQRLRIRMDDGRTVYVDTPSREFAAGSRVQLSDANEIRLQ